MASVAFQDTNHRTRGPRLLDLDPGAGPPRWVQVIGSVLLILAFVMLACFWLKPLTHPGESMLSHFSPNSLTMPAIRPLAPNQRIDKESGQVGPTTSNPMQSRMVASSDSLAFIIVGDN